MNGISDGNSASISSNGIGTLPAPIPNMDAPPPFLSKTYDIVDDPATDAIVSWSPGNNSFVVWNHAEFARDLLPKHFKHNNFSSFVRQLNTYGFRKVDSDRFEFANENFLRGQKHLLKSIRRRKPVHGQNQPQQPHQLPVNNPTVGACVEVGKFGLEEEVDRLKRDKNVLMQELVRLRQQQQSTDSKLQTMVQHLQGMEQRQQQMMSFLAKAMQSPGFLAQFVQQQTESNRRVTEANKKRRLKQEDTPDRNVSSAAPSDGQIVKYQPPKNDSAKEILTNFPSLGENFDDFNFMISDDVSTPFDSSSYASGVTLQEVPPSHTGQSQPFIRTASLSEIQSSSPIGPSSEAATETPPFIVPDNIVDIFKDDGIFMESSPGVNESLMALELDDMCPPDSDMNALIDQDNSSFWEELLAGINDEKGLSFDVQQLENEHDKNEHMDQLTEQMGHLSSDTKSVLP